MVDPEMYDVVLSQLRVNDEVLSDLLFDLSLHALLIQHSMMLS